MSDNYKRVLYNRYYSPTREELLKALYEIEIYRQRVAYLKSKLFKKQDELNTVLQERNTLAEHCNNYKKKYETLGES